MVSDAEEPRRRWVVALALYREPGERLEGMEIFEEVPPILGAILWMALQDVTLWAESDSVSRVGLFAPDAATVRARAINAAGVPSDLGLALHPLTALLDQPDQAPDEVVASACAAVSRWAESRSARQTALAFAQASARARPSDARAAVHVGDLARELRRYERAASWYRRAIGLARRARDWHAYTLSLLNLGEIALDRGNLRAAQLYATKVLRSARRNALGEFRGDAFRVLYRLAVQSGDAGAMQRLAKRVLRAYGRGNPRVEPFLLELARMWLDGALATRAETILLDLLGRLKEPADIAVADALMARAAADLRKREVFDKSWNRAWLFLRHREDDQLARTVLEDLSKAAARIGDWDRMGQAMRRADASENGGLP
jgi:tetratricopeptide (TPR) repeat protein